MVVQETPPLLELVEESDIEDYDDDDDDDFLVPSQSQESDVDMKETENESVRRGEGMTRGTDNGRKRGRKRARADDDEAFIAGEHGEEGTNGEDRARDSDGMSALDVLLMEESDTEGEEEEQWMGGSVTGMVETDAELELKEDHHIRPLWVCSNRLVLLETFSPLYAPATEFLGTVAEPVSRPQHIHEYRITSYSLYAALSVGQSTEDILDTLNSFSKVLIPPEVVRFIQEATRGVGTVHLLLRDGSYHLESRSESALATLASDRVIAHTHYLTRCDQALLEQEEAEEEDRRRKRKRKNPEKDWTEGGPGWPGWKASESEVTDLAQQRKSAIDSMMDIEYDEDDVTDLTISGDRERNRENEIDGKEEEGGLYDEEPVKEVEFGVRSILDAMTGMSVKVFSFEVHRKKLQDVLDRSKALGFPLLQEYEYEERERDRDTGAVDREGPKRLDADLKPSTRLRGYQEKSLARMFNDGRARSGIVVLPCGAGKTLVGIAAACTIRQRTLVITTVEVAVQQWRTQFKLWTTIKEDDITMFTAKSASEKRINLNARVVVSTYSMIGYGEKRSSVSQQMMDMIQRNEWGLLILDEAHVAPAKSFKRCFHMVPAQCKLGLTATFVREDDKISQLLDLIGPKLYEANWFDLTDQGFIASVDCAEVWCQMTPEFYRKYLERPELKEYLAIMNPRKFRACDYLIRYHKARGDKVIVFCDRRFPLEHYARALECPLCIHGGTPDAQRHEALERFRTFPNCNVIFISKVGDNAIDLPEANVIIQISSHFGARRQEAQRLGRILRPKKRKIPGESDSHFYSLLSLDTHEMRFAPKRQLFLLNQGYSYKVITNLSQTDSTKLIYEDLTSQLRLLSTVMTADDELVRAEEEAARQQQLRRFQGSAAALSGTSGRHYAEFNARRAQPASLTSLLRTMRARKRQRMA